jgi:hypothetical protein
VLPRPATRDCICARMSCADAVSSCRHGPSASPRCPGCVAPHTPSETAGRRHRRGRGAARDRRGRQVLRAHRRAVQQRRHQRRRGTDRRVPPTGLRGFEGVSAYVAGQARPGRAHAHRGQGARVAAHPREHAASRPDLDAVPGRHRDARTGRSRQEAAAIFDSLIPLGRHTTPDEIARAALYLACDDSAHMTAHTFAIDGGLSA